MFYQMPRARIINDGDVTLFERMFIAGLPLPFPEIARDFVQFLMVNPQRDSLKEKETEYPPSGFWCEDDSTEEAHARDQHRGRFGELPRFCAQSLSKPRRGKLATIWLKLDVLK